MVGNYALPPDIDLTEDGIFQGQIGAIHADNGNLPWEENNLANITFTYTNGWNTFEIVSDDNLWITDNTNRLITGSINATNSTIRTALTSQSTNYYKTYTYSDTTGSSTWYSVVTDIEDLEEVFHKKYTSVFGKDISPIYERKYIEDVDLKELQFDLFGFEGEEVNLEELKADYTALAKYYFSNLMELRRKLAYKEVGLPFSLYEPDEDVVEDVSDFTGWDRGRYYKNVLPWEERDSSEFIFSPEINARFNEINTSITQETIAGLSIVNLEDVEVWTA